MLHALIPVVRIQISLMAYLCHANVPIGDCHAYFGVVVVSIDLHRPNLNAVIKINAVISTVTDLVEF